MSATFGLPAPFLAAVALALVAPALAPPILAQEILVSGFDSGVHRYDFATGAFLGYRGIARDVTERVAAEIQARTADERLRQAIDETVLGGHPGRDIGIGGEVAGQQALAVFDGGLHPRARQARRQVRLPRPTARRPLTRHARQSGMAAGTRRRPAP